MALSFNFNNNKVPIISFDIDTQGIITGVADDDYRPLVIAEKLAVGSATVDATTNVGAIQTVSSEGQAKSLFGENSHGHLFYRSFAKNSLEKVLYMLPILNTAGTRASQTIEVATDATTNGRIDFEVFGRFLTVSVASGATKVEIAADILAAIQGLKNIPITATLVAGSTEKVKIDSVHTSNVINGINFDIYYNDTGATINKEAAVPAVATNFNIRNALDKISESGNIYDFVAVPYSHTPSLTSTRSWVAERRTGASALDGHIFAIKHTDLTVEDSYKLGIVSGGITVFDNQGKQSEPEILGALIGRIATSAKDQASLAFQTIELVDITPLDVCHNNTERELLLDNGISTFKKVGNTLQIERVRTLAAEGSTEGDLNDALVPIILRREWIRFISSKYRRHNITRTRSHAPNTVMLDDLLNEYRGFYQNLVGRGLVDTLTDQQLANISGEIGPDDRVGISVPCHLVTQLRSIDGVIVVEQVA